MDGLVSTGNDYIPFTILKTNFLIKKNFFVFFIHILILLVEKDASFLDIKLKILLPYASQ